MARKRRADGRIQVQIDLGVVDGKRKRKYFYGKTLKEANAAKDAWIADQERRSRVLIADADVTVAQWSKIWLESIKGTTERSTHRSKEAAARKQNAFQFEFDDNNPAAFGEIAVKDIRPIHIQTYMRSLSSMSKSTIALRRSVLKGALDAAVANNVIDRSPWIGIRSPAGTYIGHRALKDHEQDLVLNTWSGHRCGIWALTMMYSGMRREELAALDVADVDIKGEQIHIQQASVLSERGRIKATKTEAGERVVPIFPQLLKPLEGAVDGRKIGRLFLSAGGAELTETSFRQAWKSYMRYLNLHEGGADKKRGKNKNGRATWIPAKIVIDTFTAHDLRYTYATILYDAGVDVKTAAYLLGHKDITVTMKIYTQLSSRKKQQGLDALISYMQDKEKVQNGAENTPQNQENAE